MKKTIVDIAEFQRRASKGHKPGVAVRAIVGRFLAAADQSTEQDSRVRKFIFSDDSIDRYGDTINPRGWVYDETAGSVALFGHDASEVKNIIGRTQNERVEGGQFVGEIRFASAEENPTADTVLRLIDGGFINSVSVGFQPLEWKQTKDKARPGGIDFLKQELLEVSVVGIPANRNALHQAKAAGIDIDALGLVVELDAPAVSKKGMYEVSWLAMLLAELGYLEDCVEWEAEYEGDGSAVPQKLTDAMKALGQVLIDMTVEEVTELFAEEDGEAPIIASSDAVEMSTLAPAQKALVKLASIGRRARARFAKETPAMETKAGKVLSSANEKKLRDAHAQIASGCDAIMGVVGASAEDEPETEEESVVVTDEQKAVAARARRLRTAKVHQLRAAVL